MGGSNVNPKAWLRRGPGSVFSWVREFRDDMGYHPSSVGEPTEAYPGSPEKIAAIVERLHRGQSLWNDRDAGGLVSGGEGEVSSGPWRVAGSEGYGAVVGSDVSGGKHRYAVWKRLSGGVAKPVSKVRYSPEHGGYLPVLRCQCERLLYVTDTCGYVDSFEADPQLAAIERHAVGLGASHVSVVSLYTARCEGAAAIRDCRYPVTEYGFLWLRWLARCADRVVVCWGSANRLGRDADALWLLGRTVRSAQLFALSGSGDPPRVGMDSALALWCYDYRHVLSAREFDGGSGE